MARHRHLDNAPITEAIIDIRITPKEGFTIDKLEPAFNELQTDYPKKETKYRWQGLLGLRDGEVEQHAPSTEPVANFYKSPTEDRITQFRLDGFSLNKLPPYDKWETFHAEAERLWTIYSKQAHPISLERIAVRYINKIQIPLGTDFGEYLTSAPTVPASLPQELSEFLSRVVMHAPQTDAFAVVTQALGEIREADSVADIILDIDVVQQKTNTDVKYPRAILENLRDFKNNVFFEYITEKTAELYE
jgi:uncharacterized protein (TIGR04255 family)